MGINDLRLSIHTYTYIRIQQPTQPTQSIHLRSSRLCRPHLAQIPALVPAPFIYF